MMCAFGNFVYFYGGLNSVASSECGATKFVDFNRMKLNQTLAERSWNAENCLHDLLEREKVISPKWTHTQTHINQSFAEQRASYALSHSPRRHIDHLTRYPDKTKKESEIVLFAMRSMGVLAGTKDGIEWKANGSMIGMRERVRGQIKSLSF